MTEIKESKEYKRYKDKMEILRSRLNELISLNPSYIKFIENMDLDIKQLLEYVVERMENQWRIDNLKLSSPIQDVFVSKLDEPIIRILSDLKVKTIKDMVDLSQDNWETIFNLFNGTIYQYKFEKIIIDLYPKFKFKFPLNEIVTFTIFQKQCNPGDNDMIREECEGIWDSLIIGKTKDEKQKIYKDIYFGPSPPEAPDAPLPSFMKSFSGKKRSKGSKKGRKKRTIKKRSMKNKRSKGSKKRSFKKSKKSYKSKRSKKSKKSKKGKEK